MFGHVVVIGYGTTGRRAALTLVELATATGLVVVDSNWSCAEMAGYDGAHVVWGDGCSPMTLRRAEVKAARCVVVAVNTDASALLVTSAVRRLTKAAIITVVRRSFMSTLAPPVSAPLAGSFPTNWPTGRPGARCSGPTC